MTDTTKSETLIENAIRTRRPRIVIAGEFSAGKTRLLNALMGQNVLPSNVTSTSLPPMWLLQRGGSPMRLDLDGEWHAVDDISEVEVSTTKYCLLPSDAPILEHFDLIDTPGNSDPNIPPESWERMIAYADLVIWCSNANQAWRQSEKSVWNDMPDRLKRHSAIVLTHADQIPDERSRGKVLRRVERDAKDFFHSFDLLSALDANDIAGFADRLISNVTGIADLTGALAPEQDDLPNLIPNAVTAPTDIAATDVKTPSDGQIQPRRIVPKSQTSKHASFCDRPATNRPGTLLDLESKVASAISGPLDENKLIAMPIKSDTAILALTTAPASASPVILAGPARLAWNRISQDTDMTDPVAILASVDALIHEIDDQDGFGHQYDSAANVPRQIKA
ncbi:GTPase [Puniceibacterium sp. IMCC21224]|uniref:GTPase n=1 Tax=Puniceibacterium sp. IMCC21224 TaxID=1618204 RepID=UPI00065D3E85|nr:GTPase [Puniceibacterium sp. IMCC21224]KMK66434.1 50S ribosome-binding GTPase [Puniceibacterium sp. IMCC21224]